MRAAWAVGYGTGCVPRAIWIFSSEAGFGSGRNWGRFGRGRARGRARSRWVNLGSRSRGCQDPAYRAPPAFRRDHRHGGAPTGVPRRANRAPEPMPFALAPAHPAPRQRRARRAIPAYFAAPRPTGRPGCAWHRGCSTYRVRDAPVASYLRACHLQRGPRPAPQPRAPWRPQRQGVRVSAPRSCPLQPRPAVNPARRVAGMKPCAPGDCPTLRTRGDTLRPRTLSGGQACPRPARSCSRSC
jgi:hypothetical protein